MPAIGMARLRDPLQNLGVRVLFQPLAELAEEGGDAGQGLGQSHQRSAFLFIEADAVDEALHGIGLLHLLADFGDPPAGRGVKPLLLQLVKARQRQKRVNAAFLIR